MFKRISLITLAALMPVAAQAGNFVDGIYTSNLGYSIKPPENWQRVDMSNVSLMSEWLPQNISTESLDRFDVIFYPSFTKSDISLAGDDKRQADNKARLDADPSTPRENLTRPIHETPPDRETLPGFTSTVSVMVIAHKPSSMASEYAKIYADELQTKHDSMFEFATDFKVNSATSEPLTPGDAFIFNMEFRINNRRVAVDQTVLFRKSETYIITCTSDINEYMSDKRWCRGVVNTLKFAD